MVAILRGEGELSRGDREATADALGRAAYVLANTLNVQANTLPVLVLEPEPEVVQGESESTNDTDTPSVDEGQEAPE